MRKPGGYLYSDRGFERDTFKCNHCQTMVVVEPFGRPEDLGGRCGHCDSLICPKCVGKPCRHHLETIAKIEDKWNRGRN